MVLEWVAWGCACEGVSSAYEACGGDGEDVGRFIELGSTDSVDWMVEASMYGEHMVAAAEEQSWWRSAAAKDMEMFISGWA